MPSQPIDILTTYLRLAVVHGKRRLMPDRDRFLVVSSVIAQKMKLYRIASYCRHLVLEHNPGHMLRRWKTMKLALDDTDFLHFLKQVQRRFPQERAETILANFGVVRSNERDAYYDDEEYAASLLGIDVQWLRQYFDDSGLVEDDPE